MQQTPRNLWIPLLIAAVIAGGLLGSLFYPPYVVWSAIMAGMFGIIIIGHPRQLLFFYWLWVAVQALVMQMSSSPAPKYIEKCLTAAMIVICVAGYARRRDLGRGTVSFFKIFNLLLGVSLASWIVNKGPVFNAANFFMIYLAFPYIFYVAYTTLDRRHWRYLFGVCIGLMLLQFSLNIGWRLGINPLPNEWKGTANLADIQQGTFGSCAMVAYFMIINIFLLFSSLRLDKKYRIWILLLLTVAVLQWYMTYTNHSYLIFLLLLPIYMTISKVPMRVRASLGLLVVFGALLFTLFSAKDTFRDSSIGGRSQLGANFDWKNIENRWERFTQGPKVELITRITVKNATKKPFLWFLGNGPGNGLSAVAMSQGGAFAWEYLGEYIHDTSTYQGKDMESATGNFYSGILSIWSEIGMVGYVLYTGLYIHLILHVLFKLRRNQYAEPVQIVLAEGFVMAGLLFLMVSFMADIFWAKYFAGGLWIWAAMVWDPVVPEGKKTESGEPEVGGQKSAVRGRSVGGRQPAPAVNGWKRPAMRK